MCHSTDRCRETHTSIHRNEPSSSGASLKMRLRGLWKSEFTEDEIACEVGLSVSELRKEVQRLRIRPRLTQGFLPSQEHIRMSSAMIREKWTHEEHRCRMNGRMATEAD